MNNMKLQNSLDIPVSKMKDGEIGIITEWEGVNRFIGIVLQRYKDSLVPLQKDSGNGWNPIPNNLNCRVRVLQKGETLIIE